MNLPNHFYSVANSKTNIKLRGQEMVVFFDSGAEVNLIDERHAQALGIPYTVDNRLRLVDVNGHTTAMLGICESEGVSIGPVRIEQSLLVVRHASQPLILGTPYLSAARMNSQSHSDGSCTMTIYGPDGRTVRFQGSQARDHKTRRLSDLAPGTNQRHEDSDQEQEKD